MPEAFDSCVKNKGKVFTVKIGKNKFVHGCKPKGSNKAVYGEIKRRKSKQAHGKEKNSDD